MSGFRRTQSLRSRSRTSHLHAGSTTLFYDPSSPLRGYCRFQAAPSQLQNSGAPSALNAVAAAVRRDESNIEIVRRDGVNPKKTPRCSRGVNSLHSKLRIVSTLAERSLGRVHFRPTTSVCNLTADGLFSRNEDVTTATKTAATKSPSFWPGLSQLCCSAMWAHPGPRRLFRPNAQRESNRNPGQDCHDPGRGLRIRKREWTEKIHSQVN